MPTQFAALDAGFPNLTGQETTEQKVDALYNRTFMLLEYLRYILRNLGRENMNEKELGGFIKEVTTPIRISIQEETERAETAETRISIEAGSVKSEVESVLFAPEWDQSIPYAVGDRVRVTTMSGTTIQSVQYYQCITANTGNQPPNAAYWVTVNVPGNVSRIEQTANSITAEVSRAEGAESILSQTADDIIARITDGQGNYTVLNLKVDGLHIGNKIDTTTIDGGSITAGTITGDRLVANAEIISPIISGGEFLDRGKNAGIDITSTQYHERLRFGTPNQAYEYGTFGIDSYDDGTTQSATMRLFGMDILKRHGYSSSGVEAMGRWDFSGPLVLNAGYNYGSLAQRNAISSPRTGQLFFVI